MKNLKSLTLDNIRDTLRDCDIVSEEKLSQMSDENLCQARFQEDLEMDSLYFILLVQGLEGGEKLPIIEQKVWDCKTVQDLLNLE